MPWPWLDAGTIRWWSDLGGGGDALVDGRV